MRRKKVSLNDFIESIGSKKLAKKMKINRRTVNYWQVGHCWPAVKQMIQLRKMSGGALSYEEMIDNNGPKGAGRK